MTATSSRIYQWIGIILIASILGGAYWYFNVRAGSKINTNISEDSLVLGLSGYWPLDDGSGTNANDASVNNNDGTLTLGPTWTTGQIGGAVNFDGSDDYIYDHRLVQP
jgi:hypothetical protein